MDKTTLYIKLDIERPEDFKYFENLSELLELDDFIEENLLVDLIKDVDKNILSEHMDSFFEDFLKRIPDEETDLYITVDNIARAFCGIINEDMDNAEIHRLAEEINRFRKWYIHDLNAFNKTKGTESSLRDAIYDIVAAGFLGEEVKYDFRASLDYEIEGYDVMLSDIISGEEEPENEGFGRE